MDSEFFYIYRKDGIKIQVGGTATNPEYLCVHELQLDDTFLGQKQITITIKSPVPIKWKGQEYIILDDDKYTLKYEPSLQKQARKKTYGEAFVYDNVILQSVTDETTRVCFQDYVLEDNNIHYTSMYTVYFYGTVKDLAMRIQANLDRVYKDDEKWTIVLGDDLPTTEKQKTYDNVSVWDAITDIWNVYKVLFYTKGRTLYIGCGTSTVPHDFMYGIGKGLKSLKKETSEDNEIFTRLHVYGSQKNLPYRYYNTVGQMIKENIEVTLNFLAINQDVNIGAAQDDYSSANSIYFLVKDAPTSLFKAEGNKFKFSGTVHYQEGDETREVTISAVLDSAPSNAYNYQTKENYAGYECLRFSFDTYDEYRWLYWLMHNTDQTIKATFLSYTNVNINYAPNDWLDTDALLLSESLYIPNLMLPAIRTKGNSITLYDSSFKETTDESLAVYRMVKTGYGGLDMDIYLESIKGIEQFGVLEGNVTFDNDTDTDFEDLVDDDNGIYPTLSVATDGTNEIVSATQLTDAGVYASDGSVSPATFDVVIKSGFNPNLYKISGETMQISFKSGALIARTFDVGICSDNKDGTYTLTCDRITDSSIGLAFPNSSYNVQAGDKFVFLGIELPDEYIQAAEIRLLNAGLAYLANYDHTKYTYTPELDNIFLARTENKETRDALAAGATFWFTDEDVNGTSGDEAITIKLPISKLTMKIGNSLIREYEITLADTPDIDSDFITRTINAVSKSYSSGGNGNGIDEGSLKILGNRYFLSKLNNDTANGIITFLKGLKLGSDGKYYLDANGKAVLQQIVADSLKSDDFVTETAGAGYALTNGTNGSKLEVDYLLVRKLATFIELEIRKLSYVGGNLFLSKSGSTIESVEEVYDTDGTTLVGWKCTWNNDDGTTATTNTWLKGDQARCQTFNIADSDGEATSGAQRYYWRLVEEVGENYVILSATDYDGKDTDEGAANTNAQSIPKAGDVIVQAGYRMGSNANDETNPGDANNIERTNVVQMNTSGDDAPCIRMYKGITSYSFPDTQLVAKISPNGVYFNTEYFQLVHDGVPLPIEVYRGDWSPTYNDGEGYAYYDSVTWDDCRWLCVNTSGGVTSEPSEDNSDWKLTAGVPTKGRKMTIYQVLANGNAAFSDGFIAYGETILFQCVITDNKNKDHTSDYSVWSVERTTEATASDTVWNQSAVINSDGTFSLTYSSETNDLGDGSSATFTVKALVAENDATDAVEQSITI